MNNLILCNKNVLLKALFQAIKDTLFVFTSDPQHGLVGQLGFTAVLHTWERKLNAHFHLHCVIPAGVFDEPNQQWIKAEYKFLFPVKAMSKVFRGKYMELLKQARKEGKLEFLGKTEYLAKEESFAGLLLECYSKEWFLLRASQFNLFQTPFQISQIRFRLSGPLYSQSCDFQPSNHLHRRRQGKV